MALLTEVEIGFAVDARVSDPQDREGAAAVAFDAVVDGVIPVSGADGLESLWRSVLKIIIITIR